jgi:NAD(P)-dependent dehydrogenase (short-subunit alcohol dehydrogenase family)
LFIVVLRNALVVGVSNIALALAFALARCGHCVTALHRDIAALRPCLAVLRCGIVWRHCVMTLRCGIESRIFLALCIASVAASLSTTIAAALAAALLVAVLAAAPTAPITSSIAGLLLCLLVRSLPVAAMPTAVLGAWRRCGALHRGIVSQCRALRCGIAS